MVINVQVISTESAATIKASRNATVTSMLVCCGFIACWTSNEIVFFLRYIGAVNWFYHFTSPAAATSLVLQAQFLIFTLAYNIAVQLIWPFLSRLLMISPAVFSFEVLSVIRHRNRRITTLMLLNNK